jgi:hypothetical protein
MAFGSACAVPHGSNARPVRPVAEGRNLIGGGAMVPFAAAGSASFSGSDGASFSGLADAFTIIPAVNYDVSTDEEGQLFGVELSLLKSFQTGSSAFGIFLNPRAEWPLDGPDRSLVITVDGNLGFFTDGNNGVPFFSPLVGLRYYGRIGNGGLVLTQQLGTLGFFVGFPGSVAYDIAIDLGPDSTLHLFPEVRWDANAFFISDASGIIATFSGGLSFMLEM